MRCIQKLLCIPKPHGNRTDTGHQFEPYQVAVFEVTEQQ